jgi:hypothetical protein
MNFRIPEDLKNRFQETCRKNRTQMSSELVRLVNLYLQEAAPQLRVYRESSRAYPASVREIAYRDPDTGLSVIRRERSDHADR